MSLKNLVQAPGLRFPEGESIMMRVVDARHIIDNMRRALPPPQIRLTKRRAEDMIIQLLEVCHSHRELMYPRGRTSDQFWMTVMRDVTWTRGLGIMLVDEFSLAMAEAARLALGPEDYALAVSRGANLTQFNLPHYWPISWAALQFFVDVKVFKRHLDRSFSRTVRAYRGIEITEQGVRSQPLRCFPLDCL